MKHLNTWTGLLLPTILSAITLIVANGWKVFSGHLNFYIISMLAFLLLSVLSLFLGQKTSLHRNKSLFGAVVLASITFKMLLSILIIVIYIQEFATPEKWFVLPFFLMYLYFTFYETYALVNIGQLPNKRRPHDGE
jgi:hypothetical protein